MLAARLRVLLLELRMALSIGYHALAGIHLAVLRSLGRTEQVNAFVQRLVIRWSNNLFANLHCRIDIEGAEHIPRGEAFIVVSNHQSKYDIFALIAGLDMAVGFVAKRELFRIPGLSFWMRQINCFSLDRRDVSGGGTGLAQLAADLKRRGMGFVIFPEGTRTRHPQREVQPFKRGAIRLVSESGLPVLPITLDGTHLLDLPGPMADTRNGGRFVRMRIDPLRRLPGTSAPERRAFVDGLYETIRSNWEAIRVEWPHT